MSQPILSILICALQSRIGVLGILTRELHEQIHANNANGLVEIIINMDNKQKTTGKKRQELLEQANGEYICFIDDDDEIYDCYIEEMIKACKSGCDCIAMDGLMTTNGAKPIEWRISKDYNTATVSVSGVQMYLRHTNHLSPVKRSIAIQVGFPDKSNAEDGAYSNGLKGLLRTEYKINKIMYHYKFSSFNKEYK